jgi:Pentapeptide repeats (8 copies)
MSKATSLDALLKRGSSEFAKLRESGALPTDFTGATLVRLFCANANLSGLDLTGTEWEKCELSKVDFRNADLSNAYFHGGKLEDCDFTGANVDGATFEKIKLTRCDFTEVLGRDELQQSDVIARDVIGLDDDDDALEEDDDGFIHLRELLPKGFRRMALSDLLDAASKHVTVKRGDGAPDDEVQALEARLFAKFPADYRAFLKTFGTLRVASDIEHEQGALEVYGMDTLEPAHKQFRAALALPNLGPKWLEEKTGDAITGPGTLAQRKTKMRNALQLGDVHMKRFLGDRHDAMRIVHQYMVPIMAAPGELATMAECIGPDAQMYTVSAEKRQIEAPSRTFGDRFLENLENLVVGEK